MPRPDATRITWFLGLQRVLNFPRFPVAPAAFLRSRRKPATEPSETTHGGAPTVQGAATAASRLSPIVLPGTAGRKPPALQLGGAGMVTPPHFITRINTRRSAAAKTWLQETPDLVKGVLQATLKPASTSARGENSERHLGPTPGARREASGVRGKYPSMMTFLAAPPGSERSTAFAPSSGLSPREYPKELRGETARSLAGSGADELRRRQTSPSTEEWFLQKRQVADDQDQFSSDQDAAIAREQPRKKSTVSTIHIDGSALGRWTVQHLERALSKPVTGMTGIDPRAAVPRSRVAPF